MEKEFLSTYGKVFGIQKTINNSYFLKEGLNSRFKLLKENKLWVGVQSREVAFKTLFQKEQGVDPEKALQFCLLENSVIRKRQAFC